MNVTDPSRVQDPTLVRYPIEKAVTALFAIVKEIVFPCEVVPLQLPSYIPPEEVPDCATVTVGPVPWATACGVPATQSAETAMNQKRLTV